MADREFIINPKVMAIEFRLEQASTLENSLHLLGATEHSSGYDQWIYDTRKALTDEEWLQHRIVMNVQYRHVTFRKGMTYPEYIDELREVQPEKIATQAVEWLDEHSNLPSSDEAMRSEEDYIEALRQHCAIKREAKGYDIEVDEEEARLTYNLLQRPNDLHALIIEHLTMMWERFLEPEWEKRKSALEEAHLAYSQMDYTGMSPFEVIEAVTGRDMRGHFNDYIERSNLLIFSPSPHVGPYIGFHEDKKHHVTHLFYRARLPKGSSVSSKNLSRSELLTRLNALADDTRLHMIELLLEHEELCAQDFINLLDLSQSSASRHLRQLTASGYLKERRREVAKCYSLNTDRIEDTLSALRQFLE